MSIKKTLGKHKDNAKNKNSLLSKEVKNPIMKKENLQETHNRNLQIIKRKGKYKPNPDRKRR